MVASCQPPLACKGKNKSIDTIAILITPRADCGAEGRCSGRGWSRTPPAVPSEERSPSARCWLQPGLRDFCRDHPCSNEEHPFTATSAFSPEKPSLGQSVFNPLAGRSSEWPFPTGRALGRAVPAGSVPMSPMEGQRGSALQLSAATAPLRPRSGPAAALPPQTCLSTSSAGTNLPYVSANRGNCWNQCLIGFRLWQTACRYIFLCQSRRGRRGARELGDAEWK